MSTTTPPNLGVIITSTVARKIIYGAYVIAGVGVGATQVAFASINAGQPAWLTATINVLAYLSIPVGGLALANATAKTTTPVVPGNGE